MITASVWFVLVVAAEVVSGEPTLVHKNDVDHSNNVSHRNGVNHRNDVDIMLLLNGTIASDSETHYRISGELTVERRNATPADTGVRSQTQGGPVLLVAGGIVMNRHVDGRSIPYQIIADVEILSLEQNEWRTVASLPSPRNNAALAVLDGKVYSIGGEEKLEKPYLRNVDVYDFKTDSWTAGPALSHGRETRDGVAVVGSTIYVVGGIGGGWLSSAEALDAGATAWRPIADMNRMRWLTHVAVLDGSLYAVGGDGLGSEPLETIEKYDPVTDSWKIVQEMRMHCRFCSMGVVDGALYMIGGHNESNSFSSVHRYKPSLFGSGEWKEMPPMHSGRRGASVVTHRGKLYVVGGRDNDKDLDTVEVFDPATETWTMLKATMNVARFRAGAVVVDVTP